jgi:cytochrome c oxidase subunit 2
MKFIYTIGAVLLLTSQLAWAAGDAAAGKGMYGVCAACHGVNGEGLAAMNSPRLVGQEDWYLTRQIENFKSGVRGTHADDLYGQQMAPMAAVLSDAAAIANVVAYIQGLDAPPQTPSVEGDAATGKTQYAVCAACHGSNAEGMKALNSPRLVGQNDWYVVRQVQNFKTGVRGSHADDIYGQQMVPMAAILTDDQAIRNVAAYINSLQ